jgi:hypothetical protein
MGQQPGCQPPPAPVPQTGQTTSYATGDDGDLQTGVNSPVPRFTDNEDGTVTDNLTWLVWMQDADCDGVKNWYQAIDHCNSLADGTCGITDGSATGDWRLANRLELDSLLDLENHNPALPTGHPFTNVQSGFWYWSSTTYASITGYAWEVYFGDGYSHAFDKDNNYSYLWCVRDAR